MDTESINQEENNANLVGSEAGDGSPVKYIEAVEDWQSAWSRVIAYAWENWGDTNPEEGVVSDKVQDILDQPNFYLSQFGYNPYDYDLTKIVIVLESQRSEVVVNLPKSEPSHYQVPDVNTSKAGKVAKPLRNGWTKDSEGTEKDSREHSLYGALVVILPNKPKEQGHDLQALADYMQVSDLQPFTCL